AFFDLLFGAGAFGDQRIQASCTFSHRPARIIEELGPHLPSAPPIAFGCISQRRETSPVKLIGNFSDSSIGRSLLDLRKQSRHPCDKTKLQLINIKLFVIKIRSHRLISYPSSFSFSWSMFSVD